MSKAKTKKKIPFVVNMSCEGEVQCPVCDVFFHLHPLVAFVAVGIDWDSKCPNCRTEIKIEHETIELFCMIRTRFNREERQKDDSIIRRVQWHLGIPVCSILAGIKVHVAALSMKERFWLFYHLGCETAEQLVKIMWELIRLRRKHKRHLKAA